MISGVTLRTVPGQKLDSGSLVTVNVLSRNADGSAAIEVNGRKMKAELSAEVPDQFLAFVERKPGGQVMLIPLRREKTAQGELPPSAARKLADLVMGFLLEARIPADETARKAAYRLLAAGLPLKKEHVTALSKAMSDFPGMENAMLAMIAKGASLDAEFPSLFGRLCEVWKALSDASAPESTPDAKEAAGNLRELLLSTLGQLSGFEISAGNLDEFPEEWIFHRKGKEAPECYHFEWETELAGRVHLRVDRYTGENRYEARVFFEESFFNEYLDRLTEGRAGILRRFAGKEKELKLEILFLKAADQAGFWYDEETQPGSSGDCRRGMLDIFA